MSTVPPEAEAEILAELRRLRARVPQLTGALAASADGLVLAQDSAASEAETVAALTAAALGVAQRLSDSTGQGGFRELLVRGEYGYVATYAAGEAAVLTLTAEPRVNVGRLHLEARRSSVRVGELIDRTLGRRGSGVPPLPPLPPAPPT
ncbi:roadblock/LC7 domain-containing protein [Streptomyces sp. NBC_00190]|uniref:roadblock/LC7 domain-containing protein n=1 Tax=unclassified Streptomyces TaxID=2593676 RepID=UPI002E28783C|nr:roadblock/LC7 domain-containing protein [Streptomyces sp. NBC_00190]WSZ38890.1 roadblock/LC7 domain-containing protein [Streptomyces sp. NBC_00868]